MKADSKTAECGCRVVEDWKTGDSAIVLCKKHSDEVWLDEHTPEELL